MCNKHDSFIVVVVLGTAILLDRRIKNWCEANAAQLRRDLLNTEI